jgi:glucan phosphoethanolaminetransferase (alkaline phosphatase superfamily)
MQRPSVEMFAVIAHAALALGAISALSTYIPLSINVFLLHPILVAGGYLALLHYAPRLIKPILLTALTTVLTALYSAHFFALKLWNEFITWDLVSSHYQTVIDEIIALPIWIFIAVSTVELVLWFIYSKATASLTFVVRRSFTQRLLPFILVIFCAATTSLGDSARLIWEGDPIYQLLQTAPQRDVSLSSDIKTQPEIAVPSRALLKPNVILLHIDAMRADRLDVYGHSRRTTPFIRQLIGTGGHRFQNTFSNCSESICGFASAIGSRFSYQSMVDGLFSTLRSQGYLTHFIGTGQPNHAGIDAFLHSVADNVLWADFDSHYRKYDDRFVIDTLSAFPNTNDVQNFFYLRLMSTHYMGQVIPQYQIYSPYKQNVLALFSTEQEMLANDKDNRTRQVDAYLEAIFEALKEKGYLDHAIVIIFGDHGDALGERGYTLHYRALYQGEIHVPIILWHSDSITAEFDETRLMTLMDIPPTVLDLIDVPIPQSYLGRSIKDDTSPRFGLLDSKRESVGLLYQLEDQLYKLIINDSAEAELYDLLADPEELSNLAEDRLDLVDTLTATREALMAGSGNPNR